MNRKWPWDAVAFGDSVTAVLTKLGATDFARRAEADPDLRLKALKPALERIGWSELDPHEASEDAYVAAAAAKAAGASVAPWPVAASLSVPSALRERIGGIYPVADKVTRLEHLDLLESAVAVDVRTGRVYRVEAVGGIRRMPLDPFGVTCGLGPEATEMAGADLWRHAVDLNILLVAFYILGAVERVLTLTVEYAGERHQFGQPIAQFGAIQTRLADMAVARHGLAELAQYTLWQYSTGCVTPADSMALRLTTLETSNTVLTNSHQVFGAIGLTEEHDLAIIDRHVQPLLRRPAGLSATSVLLRDAVRHHGFDGLYPIRPLVLPTAQA